MKRTGMNGLIMGNSAAESMSMSRKDKSGGQFVWLNDGSAALNAGILDISETKTFTVVSGKKGHKGYAGKDISKRENERDNGEQDFAEIRAEEAEAPEVCRELSLAGKIMCGMAGLLELILLFFVFGLQVDMTPPAVLVFMWFLLSGISAGIMIELDTFRMWIKGLVSEDRAGYSATRRK